MNNMLLEKMKEFREIIKSGVDATFEKNGDSKEEIKLLQFPSEKIINILNLPDGIYKFGVYKDFLLIVDDNLNILYVTIIENNDVKETIKTELKKSKDFMKVFILMMSEKYDLVSKEISNPLKLMGLTKQMMSILDGLKKSGKLSEDELKNIKNKL